MEKREMILLCALDLFYSRGYDAVGVQEIAEKSGITKPTLYYYFGSKLGLLKSLLSEKSGELYEKLVISAEYTGDLPLTLYKTASVYLKFAMSNQKLYMLMMALFYSAKGNEAYGAVQPYIKWYYGILLKVFQMASQELGNMNGRERQFAIGFSGILNHFILMVFDQAGEDIPVITNEMTFSVVHQFMYGIYS